VKNESTPRWAEASELFRALVAPVILFILAVIFLIYDGIIDPPTEMQGTSGLALVLIAISTGLGLDIQKARGGSDGGKG
jgi:hypothetical protein